MILPVALAITTAFAYSFSAILIKGFSAEFGGLFAALAVALGAAAALGAVALAIGYNGISPYFLFTR